MNIGIVTFCEAVNYGAFLQAFCLGQYLKKNGNTVDYISTSSLKQKYWEFHNLYSYHFDRMKFRDEYRRKYKQAKKKLNIVYKKREYDLVIIGSDEMWQLRGKTFSTKPEYWGMNLKSKKIITYAVCSNGTQTEDADKFPFIKEGINKICGFSVRDRKTYETFLPLLPKKPKIHIDPTFLVDLNDYVIDVPANEKYVLVYTYGFTQDKINKTKEFAKENNLKIVSVGNKFDWCDYSVPASPFEFLGLISKAEYVVTDTFHGTVIATHLQKELFVFANEKEKVLQFINEYGLKERNVSNVEKLSLISKKMVNYQEVNKTIDKIVANSKDYLKSFLEG